MGTVISIVKKGDVVIFKGDPNYISKDLVIGNSYTVREVMFNRFTSETTIRVNNSVPYFYDLMDFDYTAPRRLGIIDEILK